MRSLPNYCRGESKRHSMRRSARRGEAPQHGPRSVSCNDSPNNSARRGGGVGRCRQLAQITTGKCRQPERKSLRPETIQLGKRQNSFHLKLVLAVENIFSDRQDSFHFSGPTHWKEFLRLSNSLTICESPPAS